MPIGIRTPGPIHHFVGLRLPNGNISAGFYLGTAVVAPEPEGEKFKLEVMNDLGGRSVPFQLVQDGEKWFVLTTLNRFDYALLQNLRAQESGGAGLGRESGIARGSLSMGVTDFVLVTVNGYAGTTSAGQFVGGIAASDLQTARTFFTCNLRKYKESTAGTRVLEVALAIECQNLFNQTTRGFTCYVEGPPQIPLNPIV